MTDRRWSRFAVIAWWLWMAAAGTPARCAEIPPTVLVLFSGEQDIALASRICWELQTLGFEARSTADAPPGETPQELSEFATVHDADALIQVHLSDASLDVWVADEITGKVVFRSEDVATGDEPTDAVLALTAVELLRASLLEIQGHKGTPKAVSALVGETENATARATIWPRIWADGGLGVSAVTDQTGPSMVWGLSVSVRAAPILRVAILGSGPAVAGRVTFPEGIVRVRSGYVSAALLGGPLDSSRVVRGTAGGGVGAAFIRMTGAAEEGYTSRDEFHACPLLFGRLGVAFRVGELLAIRLDMTLGLTTSSAVMLVAGDEVARLGLPWLNAGVAVEMPLF